VLSLLAAGWGVALAQLGRARGGLGGRAYNAPTVNKVAVILPGQQDRLASLCCDVSSRAMFLPIHLYPSVHLRMAGAARNCRGQWRSPPTPVSPLFYPSHVLEHAEMNIDRPVEPTL
jgi:hypothetical protein